MKFCFPFHDEHFFQVTCCFTLDTNHIFCIHFIGIARRNKVRCYLKVKFATFSDAKEAFNINYFQDDELFGNDCYVTA